MAGLSSVVAVLLATGGAQIPKPTTEQVMAVCRSWSSPDSVTEPEAERVNKLSNADLESYRMGRVLQGMRANNVDVRNLDLTEYLCRFYAVGVGDTTTWMQKLLRDNPPDKVAVAAPQR